MAHRRRRAYGGPPVMPNLDNSVTLRRDIADLIPTFLNNRRNEVRDLRLALEWHNFDRLTYLGNRMRGCGVPYGFDHVSMLGDYIFEAALNKKIELLTKKIAEYASYLAEVQVCFAD